MYKPAQETDSLAENESHINLIMTEDQDDDISYNDADFDDGEACDDDFENLAIWGSIRLPKSETELIAIEVPTMCQVTSKYKSS